MNSQEAKFILQAYRHHGEDANDPQMAEALEQARRDPELAAWLEEDCKLHQRMHQSLKAVPVPPDLKDTILAGAKMVEPTHWWQRPSRLAAVAAAILIATAGLFWSLQPAPAQWSDFRASMTRTLSHLDSLDFEAGNSKALKAWLVQQDYPARFVLPQSLQAQPTLGCRLLSWNRHKVSLLCFRGENGRNVHLMVMDRPEDMELPSSSQPRVEQSGLWMTVSWVHDDKVFLLAGREESDLRKFL